MAAKVRTRHESDSKMAAYLGQGKVLISSELPTLRSLLRHGLQVQEEKALQALTSLPSNTMRSAYPVNSLVDDMATALTDQWHKANVDFKYPVVINDKSVKRKIKEAWSLATNIAWKRVTTKKQIETFESKLDKLLDITKCRCIIQCCEVFGCPTSCKSCKSCNRCGDCKLCTECIECEQGHHISCSCVRELKLPLLELKFLQAQRQKTCEKGAVMISDTMDRKEQEKKEKRQGRTNLEQESRVRTEEKKKTERLEHEERIVMEKEMSIQLDRLEEQDANNNPEVELVELGVTDHLEKRNMIDISGLASTAIRYQASSRLAGALATAFLGDLIKAGVLPAQAASYSVDGAKVQRAKDKMRGNATLRGNAITEEDDVHCVMFDSRIDRKTKDRHYDEETHKFFPRVVAEDHYTLTDGQGR